MTKLPNIETHHPVSKLAITCEAANGVGTSVITGVGILNTLIDI